MTAPAVHADDANFAYDTTIALADVTIDIPVGASVALLGTNGSGKSTLLKGIVGLLEPASGLLRVLGTTPRQARPRIGYLRQHSGTGRVAPMTVHDAVRIGRYARLGWFRRANHDDTAAVDDALARLNITALAGHSLHELSGGQLQRVQLAQVFAQHADLLLLDEPFAGLDLPTQQQLLALLTDEHRRGVTIFVATHELSVARSCDLVLLLRRRILAAGPPPRVCTADNLTAAFGLLGQVGAEPDGRMLLDDRHHDRTKTRPTGPRLPARRDNPRD